MFWSHMVGVGVGGQAEHQEHSRRQEGAPPKDLGHAVTVESCRFACGLQFPPSR